MKTMQKLEQSYSQDSQTKSNESIIMKVMDNQYLIIDYRNVRIIELTVHYGLYVRIRRYGHCLLR